MVRTKFLTFFAVLSCVVLLFLATPIYAQTPSLAPAIDLAQANPAATSASNAATASESATTATDEAALSTQKIEERRDRDITQTGGEVKSRLAQLLDQNPIGSLSFTNFLQHSIRKGVNEGVPANVLVLLLLFPVIASFIATSRHVVGLEGFGVYAPAVLAVALLSTGLIQGIALFILILVVATLGRALFNFMKLQYLPRTALLLWLVSLTVFAVVTASPYLAIVGIDLRSVSIFPILVLILLSENFLEALLSGTQSRAIELTLETIVLAVISALFVSTQLVQDFVILNPEVTILAVFIIDILVGKYTGLRISEYFRFKPIIDSEE